MPHTTPQVKCFRCGAFVDKADYPDHYDDTCPEL